MLIVFRSFNNHDASQDIDNDGYSDIEVYSLVVINLSHD
jgi:hypothetical protein